ncbi:4-hydroxythreonine-4-phosphate dehydrogenase PdxA [Methylophaga lonarensis]|uniref:4-hydroxythreonine-4-phosphate dehydrogenase PdxA n=1 Tax=Methylophaga lonarensis TaxID=999151 RepID=UPI003D2E49C7
MTHRIAVTAGEPAGIGPDLCLQLAQSAYQDELLVIADGDVLQQRAEMLGLNVRLEQADLEQPARPSEAGLLRYIHTPTAVSVSAGVLSVDNAAAVINGLQIALDGCLDRRFSAVVTAPVHKGIINDSGLNFSGHTEFFADGAGVDKVVMMLATSSLRVALVTTHLPLRQVADAITESNLRRTIEITHHSLQQQFGIESPKIAVCGLNPHAGEGGHLGDEEQTIITPVIEQLVERGMQLTGPWPADTIFVKEKLGDYDAVLAMYHDQGLPVLKHQGFGQAVNITLGLPFIRTSVDHGTALELAGTGRANVSSLIHAIGMAQSMIHA